MPISSDRKYDQVVASKMIRVIHGQTPTFLIEDRAGLLHYVRSSGDPCSGNYLANQWLGSLLARSVGLPGAEVTRIYISGEFADKHNRLQDEQSLPGMTVQPGLLCATRLLGDISGSGRAFEHLNSADSRNVTNKSDFVGINLFEQWAGSLRAVRPVFLRSHGSRELQAFFNDHHLLFRGASWEGLSTNVNPEAHGSAFFVQANDQAMLRWASKLQSKLPAALEAYIPSVPPEWYSGDLEQLRSTLMHRLDGLSSLQKSSLVAGRWSAPLSALHLPSW